MTHQSSSFTIKHNYQSIHGEKKPKKQRHRSSITILVSNIINGLGNLFFLNKQNNHKFICAGLSLDYEHKDILYCVI